MVLAVPFIKPDDLSLSGGYIGAKRMLWFMAHSANKVSRDRDLGINFQVLAPLQLIPGTAIGHEVAAVCAADRGCQHRAVCHATLWLDPAPSTDWRASR